MERTAAILLAAGASSRMGSSKALLEWHGRPLIEYQIRELRAAGVDEVIVVLGSRADELRPAAENAADAAVRLVDNPSWQTGKTSSIRRGLEAIDGPVESILILAVDQPRRAELLRWILAGHASADRSIAVPTHDGRRGHPVVFAATLLPELRAISEERQGLREVMSRDAARVAELETEDDEVLIDLNTREDWEASREADD